MMQNDVHNAGVISGALLYIKDDFLEVKESSFLQVCNRELCSLNAKGCK